MPPDGRLRVKFWGTRGSIPVAMTSAEVRRKLVATLMRASGSKLDTPEKAGAFLDRELDFAVSHTFGGNSSCVEIVTGSSDYVLCDLGTGARVLGNEVLATRGPSGHTFHVFMSHVHWDHIMGFPFFMPIYTAGNRIRIYGCHARLDEVFRRLQSQLFDLGSELATPPEAVYEGMFRVGPTEVRQLEELMDRCQKDLEPLLLYAIGVEQVDEVVQAEPQHVQWDQHQHRHQEVLWRERPRDDRKH